MTGACSCGVYCVRGHHFSQQVRAGIMRVVRLLFIGYARQLHVCCLHVFVLSE